MKRFLSVLLAGILIFTMSGCGQGARNDKVSFYYPRAEFRYGDPQGVMVPETHDVSGHSDDLRYLLALYLQGPSDQELLDPFPAGTILVDVLLEEETAFITLSSGAAVLEGIELTIACACLAETCFAITDVQQVHIKSLVAASGQYVDTVITRDSVLLPGYEILPDESE